MSRTRMSRQIAPLFAAAALALSFPAAAQDADAAKAMFKENDCTKCHSPDKSKKGPSLKKISAKYKEKNQDDKEMVKQMTTARKVKLEDGSEEDHKILEVKDAKALTNLAKWILSY